ncbi:MAG: hypothetical protein R3F62_17700 [Planctomycetota bacterium]
MGWGLESSDEDPLERSLKEQFFDSLYWEGATFAFRQNQLPARFFDGQEGDHRIALETDAFLLEAMRSMAEWDRIKESIPSSSCVLRFVEGGKQRALKAHPGAPLLLLVDGRQSLEDLVRISGEKRIDAARIVATLVEEGQIEVLPPAS